MYHELLGRSISQSFSNALHSKPATLAVKLGVAQNHTKPRKVRRGNDSPDKQIDIYQQNAFNEMNVLLTAIGRRKTQHLRAC